MRQRLGGALLVALLFAGCSSESDTGADAPADLQYTVVSGDALYSIAQRFCTNAEAIVASNSWTDGIDHALFPGDAITVPGPGCGSTAEGAGTTAPGAAPSTTIDPTQVYDPYDGDPGDYHDDYGRLCMSAWDATWGLITQGASAAQVLPALEALQALGADKVPADVVDATQQAAAFNAEWYPKYVAIRARLFDPNDYGRYYEVIRTDAEFLEFFGAYLAIAATARVPHAWAASVCDPIEATTGSTP